MFEQILFYWFTAVLLLAAIGVVVARNPVYSALSLILAFFTMTALWLLMEAEFLAIALILVYVGAVMVLFLFVIMMLDLKIVEREGFIRYLPIGLGVAGMVALEMIMVLQRSNFDSERYVAPDIPADFNNAEALGELLYTHYLYPFEIAAVVLLVAVIAAILLTLRKRDAADQAAKTQDIDQQVRVKREDRVRLVKMKSE
ncbi:NADH-quinone oxidoreductase subunit J [uncultured Thiothrix sp.]|uniref:NADH-quinone oxidoreductase subunit J n=1 Tax=uncultured Thiothrix sp. TaxID=223185 RepID=UPI0026022537|nr:NADH-quinone oxidoreductase subunit J [uncultured Thiothrix sp.]HMT91447.1 NADH-quinone oxidoreductase subunit J [Thiolinea sp.]